MGAAPPRLFWRRAFAFLVDYLLATLLALAILWPFADTPDRLRLGGFLYTQTCAPLTSITEEAAAVIAPDVPTAAMVCQKSVLGRDNGLTLSLLYAVVKTENTSSSRNVSFPIDAQGKPVQPWQPQGLVRTALLVVLGGALLTRYGWTPGKYLAGLRVAQGTRNAGWREALRLLPLILFDAAALVFLRLEPENLNVLAQLPFSWFIALMLAVTALFLAYVLLPLIRWRGTMPWDRWTGRGPVTRA